MVDLGWPWWVTSLIAVGVIVAAVAAFALSKRPAVRGIAAVLAVQGAAIAIVAPFVMDSENETGQTTGAPAAMSGNEAGGFASRADANCSELGQFAASLGNPKTPAGVARNMDRIVPEFWRRYAAQARLTPLADDKAVAGEWMNAMARVGSDFEAIRNAAKRRDTPAMQAANARLSADSRRAARLSSQLGMAVCFQQ